MSNKYLDDTGLSTLWGKMKALFEPFEAVDTQDSTTAYTKQVPVSAKGLATFNKIGGMSWKVNQLVEAANNDFTITTNVSSYGNFNNVSIVSGHKYLIWHKTTWSDENITRISAFFGSGEPILTSYASGTYMSTIVSISDASLHFFRVTSNSSNITVSFHFLGGIFDLTAMGIDTTDVATAKAELLKRGIDVNVYNEYNTGTLHHSEVTKVESVGTNVWDEEWEVGGYDTNGEAITYATTIRSKATNYIQVLPNTTYYANSAGKTIYIATYDSDKNFISYLPSVNGITNNTFTTPSNAKYIRFQMGSAYGQTYNHDICINVSNSAINGQYFAYEKHELAIPSGARVKYGVNENCYDYIDFDTKTKHTVCGIVDLGSLTWLYSTSKQLFYVELASCKATAVSSVANLLTPIYTTVTSDSQFTDLTIDKSISCETSSIIRIRDKAYTNATAFKTAMSGVYLVYELATPTVTDISDILTEQHLPIQPLGTLTMVNTDKNAVPSVVTYDNGLVEVVKSNHEHDKEQQREIEKLKVDKQDKLTAGSNIIISNNTISAAMPTIYNNILALIDSSTGLPKFILRITGTEQIVADDTTLAKSEGLDLITNYFGTEINSCYFNVIAPQDRTYVIADYLGLTQNQTFYIAYENLIGVKYDPSSTNTEFTLCFADGTETTIDSSDIGDNDNATYYFETYLW